MDFLPSLPTLLAFAAATLLLAATPGPDMTLSISRALAQGKKAALFVVLGTNLGIVDHTMLVDFGISAQWVYEQLEDVYEEFGFPAP